MTAYENPFESAFAQRLERRRRLLREIRGWLRTERAPRLTVLAILLVCTAMGVLADAWLRHMGFGFRPYRWMIAAFAPWPLFLGLLRWRAGVEARRLDLVATMNQFVVHDDAAEQQECNPQRSQWQRAIEEAWGRENARATGDALGRATGGGGIFVIVILLAVSMGTWLLWDLTRLGPTLLAETMIDGVLVPAEPRLARQMHSGHWLKNIGPACYFHFVGLAFAGLLLGIFLPPDSFWPR